MWKRAGAVGHGINVEELRTRNMRCAKARCRIDTLVRQVIAGIEDGKVWRAEIGGEPVRSYERLEWFDYHGEIVASDYPAGKQLTGSDAILPNYNPSMSSILNISAYQFATLADLPALRVRLLTLCRDSHIKGTILLSVEGINLFVAGEATAIERLLAELRGEPGLQDLQPKRSATDQQPFTRMLVRLKREIIAFGVPGIEPARRTSPKLSATELKRWLDDGRPLTLLDTRNDYEVKLGTFNNALSVGIEHFRDFPAAVARLPPTLKDQPIVMFCTGGIRCEKAGPYMESQGYKHILQLDGGILKYFEECGGAHYHGECFVFDQRVGVDTNLQETAATQCYNCLTPLNEAEQQDARYVPGTSCPHCYQTAAEQMAATIATRHEAIVRATTPLPGGTPYDNYKPLIVPQSFDGKSLLALLTHVLNHLPLAYWHQECTRGLLLNARHEPIAADHVVRAGERYLHKFPNVTEPAVNGRIEILHEDAALLVLNKPAPLPMHAGGRFYRNTLQYILQQVYQPQKPRPAHRLDANTTGLVLVARTRHYAGELQPQFANGQVVKHYLVRVAGQPPTDAFSCDAPISAQAGELGRRCVDWYNGLPAHTEFRLLQRNDDGSSLLEARPLTGRTNQIRIHCAHLGFPVRGDTTYVPGIQCGGPQTLNVNDPPLELHAWKLGFIHPLTTQRVEFTAPAPPWAGGLAGQRAMQ
jgi:RluA family pseudouridine synthase